MAEQTQEEKDMSSWIQGLYGKGEGEAGSALKDLTDFLSNYKARSAEAQYTPEENAMIFGDLTKGLGEQYDKSLGRLQGQLELRGLAKSGAAVNQLGELNQDRARTESDILRSIAVQNLANKRQDTLAGQQGLQNLKSMLFTNALQDKQTGLEWLREDKLRPILETQTNRLADKSLGRQKDVMSFQDLLNQAANTTAFGRQKELISFEDLINQANNTTAFGRQKELMTFEDIINQAAADKAAARQRELNRYNQEIADENMDYRNTKKGFASWF